MKRLSETGQHRARHALYWAKRLYPALTKQTSATSALIIQFVQPWTAVVHGHTTSSYLVTVIDSITMAIAPDRACQVGLVTIVPGLDHTGRAGFLVIKPGQQPSHSYARTMQAIVRQFSDCYQSVPALGTRIDRVKPIAQPMALMA